MSRIVLQRGDSSNSEDLVVILDGRVVDNAEISKWHKEKPSIYFYEGTTEILASITFAELFSAFTTIDITLRNWEGLRGWEIGTLQTTEAEDGSNVELSVGFDLGCWSRPYGVNQLAFELRRLLDTDEGDLTFSGVEDEGGFLNGFGISAPIELCETVSYVLDRLKPKVDKLIRAAETNLLQDSNAIISVFDFPEPVRTACEQYLAYFGQFLRDLGIDASTSISERASEVLFTVEPKDKTIALDTIRDALNAYLKMPGSSEAAAEMAQGKDISILQLRSNIFHLQSQLALLAAIVQAKDATISAQITELTMLRNDGDLRRYLPSSSSLKNKDSEPLIEGLVDVESYKTKGFVFDLPNILRTLKRKVGK